MTAPRKESRNGKVVAGIQIRTNNGLEMEADDSRLSRLWERFKDEELADRIPDKAAGSPVYGVYSEYENGAQGDYSVLAGVEVSDEEKVPDDYATLILEAGDYLVFEVAGPAVEAAPEAWGLVWNYFEQDDAPQRAFATDFEVYGLADDKVELYIGVKGS